MSFCWKTARFWPGSGTTNVVGSAGPGHRHFWLTLVLFWSVLLLPITEYHLETGDVTWGLFGVFFCFGGFLAIDKCKLNIKLTDKQEYCTQDLIEEYTLQVACTDIPTEVSRAPWSCPSGASLVQGSFWLVGSMLVNGSTARVSSCSTTSAGT